MKRIIALCLCFILCTIFLSACKPAEDAYAPTGDGLTWEEDTGDDGKEAQSKQEITLTYYPDRSMNPYACTDFTNRALFSLLYQGLFAVDRDYHVEPMLCGRYRMSQDMKTYVFYLADNARFSDGTPVTPADVIASLTAAKSSKYYGGRFHHITWFGDSEDGGVQVNVDTPFENLPLLLDIPIVKQSEVDHNSPIGTGPYTQQAATNGLLFRRQTNWWCKADMAIKASAIAVRPATAITQIRDDFETGKISVVCADPGSGKYADYRSDFELWDCETGVFMYLVCNTDSKVFSNVQVRQAVTYAIDRDAITSKHYRGFARSSTLPASPNSPYYSLQLAEKYDYDAPRFLQAVQEAGLENYAVSLLVNGDDTLRLQIAREIADMLRAGGLLVEMKELQGAEYQYALSNRDYDLYVTETKLSPNMDLSPYFAERGTLSYGGIADFTFSKLCENALANHGNYYTLHQKIMEEGMLCPILFRSYGVYAERGLVTDLTPARDAVFYYSIGKTMQDALITD